MIHPPRTGMEVFEVLEEHFANPINDTIVMSPAPLTDHQSLSRDIFRAVDRKVMPENKGEVFYAPLQFT